MLLGIFGEDEDVADIPPHESPQMISKSVIDDALERRWCIAEAEGHDDPFEGPKLRVEGSFLDIFVWIRIWWNPLTRLFLEKTVVPPSVLNMVWMEGKGY